LSKDTDANKGLKTHWNSQRLREGDKVGNSDVKLHPNQWDPAPLIKRAYAMLGKGHAAREGIDGEHNHLAVASTVASVLQCCQDDYIQQNVRDTCDLGFIPFVQRFYDCTPNRMKFGRMQQLLHPHARYAIPDGTKWKVVGLDDYMRLTGRRKPARFGILELMGQGITCHFVSPTSLLSGFRVLCPPRILQHGGSSCLYSAVEDACETFSHNGLIDIANRSRYLFYSERPDAASSCKRKRAKSEQERQSIKNLLEITGECGAHQAHRIVASREPGVIGNVHAVCVTGANVTIQNTSQALLWLLLDELLWVPGNPDPAWLQHNKTVMKWTLLRTKRFVNASASFFDADDHIFEDEPHVAKVLRACNGDWTQPRLAHFCQGCCANEAEAKMLVFTALCEVDLLMSDDTNEPSMDDWFSCGEKAGKIAFGIMLSDTLPRILCRSLPGFIRANDIVNEGAGGEGAAIARAKISKKAKRSLAFLESTDEKLDCCLYALNGIAIEHLMKRLDYLDEAKWFSRCLQREHQPIRADAHRSCDFAPRWMRSRLSTQRYCFAFPSLLCGCASRV
jgi:hypothetical protein